MVKSTSTPDNIDVQQKITLLREMFIIDDSSYYLHLKTGAYAHQKKRLTDEFLSWHLEKRITVGPIFISQNWTSKVACVDFDGDSAGKEKDVFTKLLDSKKFEYLAENSGGRGFHVWLFVEETLSYSIREFIKQLLSEAKLPKDTEIFPKQDDLSRCKFGNTVKIPFSIHKRTGNECKIINAEDPWLALATIKRIEVPLVIKTISKSKQNSAAVMLTTLPPCVKYSLENKIDSPGRHEHLTKNFAALLYNFKGKDAVISQYNATQEKPRTEFDGWFARIAGGEYSEFNCIEVNKFMVSKQVPCCLDCSHPCRPMQDRALDFNLVLNSAPFDSSQFTQYFAGSSKHLLLYDVVESALDLIGETYDPIKKFVCYFMHSARQKTLSSVMGKAQFDNRLHGLIFCPVARGKGTIKSFIKRLATEDQVFIEASGLIHPEQNIGKMLWEGVGKAKRLIEVRGYLGATVLMHDECQNVLNEVSYNWADCQRIKRLAMDTYGKNGLSKKLVNQTFENSMFYFPPVRVLDFAHPVILDAKFFDTGSFRRYFAFLVDVPNKYDVRNSYKSILEDPSDDVEQLVKLDLSSDIKNVEFDGECKERLCEWLGAWSSFLLTHKNQKLRRFGETTFFSIKDLFLKMNFVLHLSYKKDKSSLELVDLACFDTVQFLMETVKVLSRFGNPINVSDIWNGADEEEIFALEYLWLCGALSPETSKITIYDFTNYLGKIYGVQDRQAMSKFGALKRRGLIFSRKSRGKSVVWLAFRPKLTDTIDITTHGKSLVELLAEVRVNYDKMCEKLKKEFVGFVEKPVATAESLQASEEELEDGVQRHWEDYDGSEESI